MDAEQFFKGRQGRAELKNFDAIMRLRSGQPPRTGAESVLLDKRSLGACAGVR
jgi:hypothetical protein